MAPHMQSRTSESIKLTSARRETSRRLYAWPKTESLTVDRPTCELRSSIAISLTYQEESFCDSVLCREWRGWCTESFDHDSRTNESAKMLLSAGGKISNAESIQVGSDAWGPC